MAHKHLKIQKKSIRKKQCNSASNSFRLQRVPPGRKVDKILEKDLVVPKQYRKILYLQLI
uniref:Uncharacterized protein n=1 Tax=Onchocerca volvulus TaxID=6282 RepID=A0A8R1TUJ8_ONCVO